MVNDANQGNKGIRGVREGGRHEWGPGQKRQGRVVDANERLSRRDKGGWQM